MTNVANYLRANRSEILAYQKNKSNLVGAKYLDQKIAEIEIGNQDEVEDALDELRYYGFLGEYQITKLLRGDYDN